MFAYRAAPRLVGALFAAFTLFSPALAQEDPRAEQARLAAYIQHNPTDYEATYRYVLLSTELRDYEAGIGALERILMFNPNLSRARKELGLLYARLGAYELSAQHLRKALAEGELDPVQVAQIEAQLPDIEKRTQANRLYLRMHVGLRAQSNANFFPTNSLFQVGGVGVASAAARKGDVNSFQLVQAAHDLDFQNARGDQLETRVTGYATQQFRLPQYSVALFAGSIGPRIHIAPDLYPGLSVKPYVTGAVALLGGTNYLNAGGAGMSFGAELTRDLWFEPGAEWRAIWVNPTAGYLGYSGYSGFSPYSTVSTLATGDVVTGYLSSSYRLTNDLRLEGRAAYTRAWAGNPQQSSDQVDLQAMLRYEIDPPFLIIPRRWTIAPYGRYTHLAFDAANPVINPLVARRDNVWIGGLMVDLPVTAYFGFAGNFEYARNDSNIPNFKTENVSVSFGPTAKF
ncbi:MAG: tetratricopeptide repeat protein [Methylocystis sp.]|uniref:tetratricopeptide repeat protein n=1 Tax=Methylocystis sp. TaxID=1911079 RepID=UPI003D0D4D9D